MKTGTIFALMLGTALACQVDMKAHIVGDTTKPDTTQKLTVAEPNQDSEPLLMEASFQKCPSERGRVKGLTDPEAKLINWNSQPSTIERLTIMVPSSARPTVRTPAEEKVYQITGTKVLTKSEADGDLHTVIKDRNLTMIVETPNSACIHNPHLPALEALRQRVLSAPNGAKVVVTGVLFFDFAHGQTGHAQNYVELHPVIDFQLAK